MEHWNLLKFPLLCSLSYIASHLCSYHHTLTALFVGLQNIKFLKKLSTYFGISGQPALTALQFFLSTMSSNKEDKNSFTSKLSLQLTTYSLVKTGKGLKKTLALKKDTGVKTKQTKFTFTTQDDNYLLFQNDILSKYRFHTHFKSTSRHFFPVKIYIPPKKYNISS